MATTAKAATKINSVFQKYVGPFLYDPKKNPTDFDGDNPDFPHDVLWNKEGYLARFQNETRVPKTQVLIVGGGIGGLTAAYYLKNKNVVLLEQAPQLGGNSKGYAFTSGASPASIGTAYITIPDAGSELEEFLKELKLDQHGRREDVIPVYLQKTPFKDFQSALSVDELEVFKKIRARLSDIFENQFPDIPLNQDSRLSDAVLDLDKISFATWLKNEFGNVPPVILELYQLYGWSSFAGSIEEISAAQFLNFIAAEIPGIWAFPGGNSAIVEKVYDAVKDSIDIQCGAFVVDIEKIEAGYRSKYVMNNELYVIESEFVIFAAPKFLADKVLSPQFSAITKVCESIEYRSYLVANILLKEKMTFPGYDQFILDGQMPPTPAALRPAQRPFADIVNANWAASTGEETNMLTIYRPMPYAGARQFLFKPTAFDKHKRIIIEELKNFGVPESNIESFYLTRWGHALPLSHVGMLASEILKPLYPVAGQSLYFVGQDVYANPAFETAFETAVSAAGFINEQL